MSACDYYFYRAYVVTTGLCVPLLLLPWSGFDFTLIIESKSQSLYILLGVEAGGLKQPDRSKGYPESSSLFFRHGLISQSDYEFADKAGVDRYSLLGGQKEYS